MEPIPALVSAYTLVGVFLGEVIKKFKLEEWIVPINMAIGGLLGMYFMSALITDPETGKTIGFLGSFLIGAGLGSGASGVYSVGRAIKNGVKR
ncbi:MAG: hypothetical protein GY838_13710 [bacterium]|nr:hypothetical protein [bacterium]